MARTLETEVDVLGKYKELLNGLDPLRPMGRVLQVTGMSIITEGPPEARIGDLCKIQLNDKGEFLTCEVVGFQGHHLVQMPMGTPDRVFPEAGVLALGRRMTIPVSDQLLGRVLDGLGRPLDGRPPIISAENRNAEQSPPNPIQRPPIRSVLETGVRSIDSMLTIGAGQRMGIFAGTGVGKSTLLGMIARYTQADVNVICMVGERSREVREFLESDLGEEGLRKSVVFASTNDVSAMEKVYAANFAMSVAEYFRDKGLQVNLYMDSLTRYCHALREIGQNSGEQQGPSGYPPGVWLRLGRLLERAGTAPGGGSITGLFTVLVEADDMNEPVADHARGILDGHMVLSRRLAHRGHYPSIEVHESVSRVMDKVITAEHKTAADRLKKLISAYNDNEELINLGAYPSGSNESVDEYLAKRSQINSFLQQPVAEQARMTQSLSRLQQMMSIQQEDDFY
ncbi:MAG: FliI/YscN family ATPase [Leptospiraceae bacterium]|nr:FliI/YscN family ATPase [Leptospiraceae bacterium]